MSRFDTGHAYARPKRIAERALALVASSSRFFGAALVSSESTRRRVTAAISCTAWSKVIKFFPLGLRWLLTLRTYWSAAAKTSSSVAGGSKLNSGRRFRHMAQAYPPDAGPRDGRLWGKAR